MEKGGREVVEVNIGGKRYATYESTLKRHKGSVFEVLLSGRHELTYDKHGAIFLDRNGKLFEYVLEYMREGEGWEPPEEIELQKRLIKEFDYYLLALPVALRPLLCHSSILSLSHQRSLFHFLSDEFPFHLSLPLPSLDDSPHHPYNDGDNDGVDNDVGDGVDNNIDDNNNNNNNNIDDDNKRIEENEKSKYEEVGRRIREGLRRGGLERIYKAKEGEFRAKEFHEKCDNKGPTITIVKFRAGVTIGAYTSFSWTSPPTQSYVADASAFLFSISDDQPMKKHSVRNYQTAILHRSDMGPIFGDYQISIGELSKFTYEKNCLAFRHLLPLQPHRPSPYLLLEIFALPS